MSHFYVIELSMGFMMWLGAVAIGFCGTAHVR